MSQFFASSGPSIGACIIVTACLTKASGGTCFGVPPPPFFFFGPLSLWDLSFLTRDEAKTPALEAEP